MNRCCFVLLSALHIVVAFLNGQTLPKREFRGVWISSVSNIDFPSRAGDTPDAQREEFQQILDQHQRAGINAVFVQIRPSSDALYQSAIEPWSQWLTGAQGRAPSPLWDPLRFMIEEAHKRGMELHAWFNPFRSVVSASSSIAPTHISQTQPAWHLAYRSPHRLLNPGLPEVRNYVLSVIMDVVRRYDIDGVHFDDYFYPYEGTTTQDIATFQQHSRGFSNIEDWRRDNVNIFVKAVSDSIRAVKPFIKFGISPFGIWRNGVPSGTTGLDAYSVIYCDALAWLQARTVDYIIPQLYWRFGGGQDFARLMPWWNAQAIQAGRHMYAGLGVYRLTDAAWTADEIVRQIEFTRSQRGAGVSFFSSNALTRDIQGIRTAVQQGVLSFTALPTLMPWKDSIPPQPPRNLRAISMGTEIHLSWQAPQPARDGDTAVKYVVYAFSDTMSMTLENPAAIVAITPELRWRGTRQRNATIRYAVTALDRLSNESAPVHILVAPTASSLHQGSYKTGVQRITPNPSYGQATIVFALAQPEHVRIDMVDNLGRIVLTILDEQRYTGEHSVELSSDQLPSGVYGIRFQTASTVETVLLVVQK
ncbi:MAG: family 10 glycosylhydrolase [Bacteroidota bacterium]|nr:family 10 glycosylhydrolase [Candidatus Kapabacteria bacterium]MDW8220541.1 family 10 glycosylhydrolase [Bacteroidota bacterium]